RALELNSNSANTHYFYAIEFLVAQNRIDQALQEFRAALSLDPLSPIVNANYALTLMMARRYPEALAQFQKTLARDPNFKPGHFKLSQFYATTGRFAEGVDELQKYATTPGSFSRDANGYLALTLAMEPKNQSMAVIAAA